MQDTNRPKQAAKTNIISNTKQTVIGKLPELIPIITDNLQNISIEQKQSRCLSPRIPQKIPFSLLSLFSWFLSASSRLKFILWASVKSGQMYTVLQSVSFFRFLAKLRSLLLSLSFKTTMSGFGLSVCLVFIRKTFSILTFPTFSDLNS